MIFYCFLSTTTDAVVALAEAIAGTEENFVKMMNDKAKELGLEHTNFVNETGLDAENHYSTVKDVATIFKYAINNPTLKEIFSTDTYTTTDNNLSFFSTVKAYQNNYNLDMDYLIGGKTGTTDEAGLCLATIASSNNTNYLLVTTGSDIPGGHIKDAKLIYDYFIENYQNYEVISDDDIILTLKTKNAKEREVVFLAEKDMSKYLANGFTKNDLTYQYEGINEVNYFTKVGSKLGVVDVVLNGEIIDRIDIVLKEKLTFSLLAFLINYWYGILIILILISGFMVKKKKSK